MSQPASPHDGAPFHSSRWVAIGLSCAALPVAYVLIQLGLGLVDGFDDWGLHRESRRLVRYAPAYLAYAVVLGLVLHALYSRMLSSPKPAPGVVFFGIARAFVLFPVVGLVAMGLLLWAGLLTSLAFVSRWVPPLKAWLPDDARTTFQRVATSLETPFYFCLLMLPLGQANQTDDESTIKLPESAVGLTRRLVRLGPAFALAIMLLATAESEDTGDRLPPAQFAVPVIYWVAEWAIVAFQVFPRMLAKEKDELPPGRQ